MRTIKINGKTFTIESGKSPSPRERIAGRQKGEFRVLIEALKDGESVFVPSLNPKSFKVSTRINAIGKALGARFAYRQEGDGIRIYRLACEPETHAPKRSYQKRANGVHALAA